MSPRPPWWRPFARRAWDARRHQLEVMDVSMTAEMYASYYNSDTITEMAGRRHPMLGLINKDAS
jgi:hypothetical protein